MGYKVYTGKLRYPGSTLGGYTLQVDSKTCSCKVANAQPSTSNAFDYPDFDGLDPYKNDSNELYLKSDHGFNYAMMDNPLIKRAKFTFNTIELEDNNSDVKRTYQIDYVAFKKLALSADIKDGGPGDLKAAVGDVNNVFLTVPQSEYTGSDGKRTSGNIKEVTASNNIADLTGTNNFYFYLVGTNKATGSYGYVDHIEVELSCSLKALYTLPATGGGNSGSFSGEATWFRDTEVSSGPSGMTKPLTFTTNDGYKLVGWKVGNEERRDLGNTINAVLDGRTVYQPIIELVKHELILHANENSIHDNNGNIKIGDVEQYGTKTYSTTYTIESGTIDLTSITAHKTAFDFTGWKSQNGQIVSSLTFSATDLIKGTGINSTKREYFAQYTPQPNAVTFYDFNGPGSGGAKTVISSYETGVVKFNTYAVSAPVGYDFTGYWENVDTNFEYPYGNTEVEPRSTYQKFRAKFKAKEYTIKFTTNGGTYLHGDNGGEEIVVAMDSAPRPIKIPTKPGYYTRWRIKREGTTKDEVLTIDDTLNHVLEISAKNPKVGNREYIAEYVPIDYDLRYNGYSSPSIMEYEGTVPGDGRILELLQTSGPPNTQVGSGDHLNDMTIPGYKFLGWVADGSMGSPTLSYEIAISPAEDPYAEEKHPETGRPVRYFTAHFKPIRYELSYNYTTPAKEKGSVEITHASTPSNNINFSYTTLEKKYENSLERSSATGYDFAYWEIWVQREGEEHFNHLKNAEHPYSPKIETDLDGNNVLGNYKYIAIYTPRTYTITYELADGIHDSYFKDFKLRQTYSPNKARRLLLQEDNTNTPINVDRPGYAFDGFKLASDVINSFNKEFTIEPHTFYRDLNIVLNFVPHEIVIKATPKLLYKGELSDSFPEFEEDGLTNKGVPLVEFNNSSWNKNMITLNYVDGLTVYRKAVYDPKIYKFVGWDYLDNGVNTPPGADPSPTAAASTISVVPTVNNAPTANEYYAIFEYAEYTVEVVPDCVTPEDNQVINGIVYGPGFHGDLFIDVKNTDAKFTPAREDEIPRDILSAFTDKGITPATNSIQYENGKFSISNLHYKDKIDLTMLPHSTNVQNKRLHFTSWDGENKNTLLEITVGDDSWSSAFTRILHPKFEVIDFSNTIKRNQTTQYTNDLQILEQLLNCSITNFILVNAINTIGDYGFYKCNQLEYVLLPGVNNIGDYAFDGCSKLKSVILSSPNPGKTGDKSFRDCSNLNLIILPSGFVTLTSLFNQLDNDENESNNWSLLQRQLGRIYVHKDSLPAYLTNTNWCQYGSIIRPLPSNLSDSIIYNEPILESDEGQEETL